MKRIVHHTLFAALLLSLGLGPISAKAISSTDIIAKEGKPVAAKRNWPTGVIELVNDPLRTDGWLPWFSECSNDVSNYGFRARNVDEMNHLMTRLAAIKSTDCQILLSPEEEVSSLGFTTVLEKGNGNTAVFSIGDQARINQWFEHLDKTAGPDVKPGTRTFGVHRYSEPPKALPPTLTLHLGNKAFDLEKLRFPASVKVVSDFPEYARKKFPDQALLKKLDDRAARHGKEQEKNKTPITK